VYILDTDVCIEILRANRIVINKITTLPDNTRLFTSVINASELFHGAYNSRHPALRIGEVKEFLQGLEVLPLNLEACEKYGELKTRLKIHGVVIPDIDLFIASIALVHNLVLVTHNISHYQRIKELVLEDWLIEDSP